MKNHVKNTLPISGKGLKVYVGLSGGVDSSVSAALLKSKGFDVTGVFIKAWHPDFLPCNWKEDRRDAMRVCAKLNIPFQTLDLESEYKKEVVDYMLSEYKKGRTPNPDVMCNKEIKFGFFLKYARKNGANFVATGHYAMTDIGATSIKNKKKIHLFEAKDKNKDQSYFLWTLKQNQLNSIIFPVGDMLKSKVRIIAKKYKLATASKKDSQGLCFVGKVDMKNFLSHFIKSLPGVALNTNGKKIGTHNGAIFLTIGQRHGFTVLNKKTHSKPYYIVSKNIRKNTITISEINEEIIFNTGKRDIRLSNVNWIDEIPQGNTQYEIRLRYHQKPLKATIQKAKGHWIVNLDKPAIDISSGQSLVVYKNEKCFGGGIIE